MAKGWRPLAASRTPATYPMANVLRGKYTPLGAHFQSTRGRRSWNPYGRPQSTEVQAVLGFPPDSQALTLAAVPPAPLPSEHSVQYTKDAFRVKQNLHHSRRICWFWFSAEPISLPRNVAQSRRQLCSILEPSIDLNLTFII
jgi:hypothetical protein